MGGHKPRAPEPAARAVATEVWRVLGAADNREWLAAALGMSEDPADDGWDGDDADDPFGEDPGPGDEDGGTR